MERRDLGVAHCGLESLPGCVGAEKGCPTHAADHVPHWP